MDEPESASGEGRTRTPSLAAVRSKAVDTCQCGSGLPFSRCHGDPRNEFAREQALREAESVAMLFPSVRLHGEEIDAFAERAAAAYPDDDPPGDLLEEGVALVDAPEWRRLVDSWAEIYADRWQSLTETAADRDAAEAALVKGALRAAIAERQATPLSLVEVLEEAGSGARPSPRLRWSCRLCWRGRGTKPPQPGLPRRMPSGANAASRRGVAYALMSFAHIGRTRRLARGLAWELPIAELPEASKILSAACVQVESEIDSARAATVGAARRLRGTATRLRDRRAETVAPRRSVRH